MLFDEKTINTFKESIERCQTNPHFLSLFYNKFITSNPVVREKFSNTNMENQKMMLHASLHMLMLSCLRNDAANVYLESVAKRHSKSESDIKPELYDLWMEKLVETVKEIDKEYNKEIETAWRMILTHGIDYMKSRYNVD